MIIAIYHGEFTDNYTYMANVNIALYTLSRTELILVQHIMCVMLCMVVRVTVKLPWFIPHLYSPTNTYTHKSCRDSISLINAASSLLFSFCR